MRLSVSVCRVVVESLWMEGGGLTRVFLKGREKMGDLLTHPA